MNDQILRVVKGPLVLVGPALVYSEDKVSIMVITGVPGAVGSLHELVLGDLIGEIPDWASAADTVLHLRGSSDITMSEARALRLDIIAMLRANSRQVEAFDTDIALSIAYADRFPSAKSRQILNEVTGVQVVATLVEPQLAAALPLVIAPRTTSDAAERAKLTPKLRYNVLLRDNFRCRACGFGVESGAHLHIDHIHPISAGGLTEFNNLQALCSVCNQGKGARR